MSTATKAKPKTRSIPSRTHETRAIDPRSVVSQSRLEEDPRLMEMWAGYAFARDFREERGHAYMLDDQIFTERQLAAKQPGACLPCHASMYVAYKRAGNGDLIKGFEKLNPMPTSRPRSWRGTIRWRA